MYVTPKICIDCSRTSCRWHHRFDTLLESLALSLHSQRWLIRKAWLVTMISCDTQATGDVRTVSGRVVYTVSSASCATAAPAPPRTWKLTSAPCNLIHNAFVTTRSAAAAETGVMPSNSLPSQDNVCTR